MPKNTQSSRASLAEKRTRDVDGADNVGQLFEAGFMLLFAALVYAALMILFRLPDLSPSPTLEVTGTFTRSEPISGGLVSVYRGQSGSLRVRLFLKDDAIAYGVSDSGGHRWQAARDILETGDHVTLLVDRDAYRRMRDRHEEIYDEAERTRNFDNVAAELVRERKLNPVPLFELRVDGHPIFSRLSMLHLPVGELVFWSAVAAAIIALLFALNRYDRRRKIGPRWEGRF